MYVNGAARAAHHVGAYVVTLSAPRATALDAIAMPGYFLCMASIPPMPSIPCMIM